MVIIIKKGRAVNKPEPAEVVEGAQKASVKYGSTMVDQLREALETDPRYIESLNLPNEKRAKTCEFCEGIYIVPCDSEEKDFCINHLFKVGKVKTTAEWMPLGLQGNALRLKRLAERKAKG